jgi:hypothetical protein
MRQQGGNLRDEGTRMRLAHEVYRDPTATTGQRRRALRVMRASYASKLAWSNYGNKGTVRRDGKAALDERAPEARLRSFGFVITPGVRIRVARESLVEDKALRRRTGVPINLLLGAQPEDNLRNRMAPLGSTRRVRSKLDKVNATLSTARRADRAHRARKSGKQNKRP